MVEVSGWAELAAAVEGREFWTLGAGTELAGRLDEIQHPPAIAWYDPDPGRVWMGRVQLAALPDRRYHRFHISILRGGVAVYTAWANAADEAVRLTEAHTNAQLGPEAEA